MLYIDMIQSTWDPVALHREMGTTQAETKQKVNATGSQLS